MLTDVNGDKDSIQVIDKTNCVYRGISQTTRRNEFNKVDFAMFVHMNFVMRKTRSLMLRVFGWIENNNNIDFASNGEEYFIDAVNVYLTDLRNVKIEIFDIGANKGEYSKILLDKLSKYAIEARIHIFEPTASCFELLSNQYSSMPSFVLNQTAVSNENGSAQIYYDQQESVLASLHQRNLSALGLSLDCSETVQTVRLDTYIEAQGINHIQLLKIDIEGHELAAFEGMGRFLSGDFVDFVQFEYGGANLDSKTSLMELYALFEARGFVVGKIMPTGIELRSYQPWMENFQYANYVAVSKNILKILM